MDVRSIEEVEPVIEHNGTVPVWWLVNPREMFDITKGGHLELVSEFEVAGGGLVDPHEHPTHEFYYVTSGRGLMTIADEEREIRQGDLVHIPPNACTACGRSATTRRSTASASRSASKARARSTTPSTEWAESWWPAVFPTAGWIRSPRTRSSGPTPTTRRSRPTSCARVRGRGRRDRLGAHRQDRRRPDRARARRAGCVSSRTSPSATTTSTSAAAREHGIVVCNTPGVLDETTADLAFTLILAASRLAHDAEADLRAGRVARLGDHPVSRPRRARRDARHRRLRPHRARGRTPRVGIRDAGAAPRAHRLGRARLRRRPRRAARRRRHRVVARARRRRDPPPDRRPPARAR